MDIRSTVSKYAVLMSIIKCILMYMDYLLLLIYYRLDQCCTVTVAKEKEKILTYVERFTHLEGRKRRGAGMALPRVRFIT